MKRNIFRFSYFIFISSSLVLAQGEIETEEENLLETTSGN